MGSKIKIGEVVFEVPEGSSASVSPEGNTPPPQASKPDTPEALEETPYVYRPNDAFQSAVDEARAIASISSEQKPWVIKTWFVLFVMGPLVYGQLFALALAQHEHGWTWIRTVAGVNLLILPLWSIYYGIWRRKVNKEPAPKLTALLIALILVCGVIVLFAKNESTPAVAPEYSDAAVVAQLAKAGSDLSKPHSIDFYLYFPTESGAKWAADRLAYMKFQVEVRPPQENIPQWQLLATRSMRPDVKELEELRAEFNDLTAIQHGVYDGWETQIVK